MNSIKLTQHKVEFLALVNSVMKLQVPQKQGIFEQLVCHYQQTKNDPHKGDFQMASLVSIHDNSNAPPRFVPSHETLERRNECGCEVFTVFHIEYDKRWNMMVERTFLIISVHWTRYVWLKNVMKTFITSLFDTKHQCP